jgi:hypothetical protein
VNCFYLHSVTVMVIQNWSGSRSFLKQIESRFSVPSNSWASKLFYFTWNFTICRYSEPVSLSNTYRKTLSHRLIDINWHQMCHFLKTQRTAVRIETERTGWNSSVRTFFCSKAFFVARATNRKIRFGSDQLFSFRSLVLNLFMRRPR